MGKDKSAGGIGKRKQVAGGSYESAPKDKGNAGKADGLGTCTYVLRHILCEKQGKIDEAHKKLDTWLGYGYRVPPPECAKMAGPFQDVAFATPAGATSAPYESTQGIPYYLEQGDEELIEPGITLTRGQLVSISQKSKFVY